MGEKRRTLPIRVLIVDDHLEFRYSLRKMLESTTEFNVVAEAGSGAEAITLARKHLPDVAVVDVRMKGMSGISATEQILCDSPRTAILMLSVWGEKQYVRRSIEAGAHGFLIKDRVQDELFSAIRTVHQGGYSFSALNMDSPDRRAERVSGQ